MFEAFKNGRAELPRNARQLGRRVKDGFGDYYRQENWTSRYDEHGKPDHYAHAENYCLQAMFSRRPMRFYMRSGDQCPHPPTAAWPG